MDIYLFTEISLKDNSIFLDLKLNKYFGPKKDRSFCTLQWSSSNKLLGAGIFGDGLGSLRDSVFGQFTGEKEPDGGLDLPGSDGGPLVVVGQFGSLGSDTLKEIIDERVHDAHGFGGDTGVGVHLLQHLVDVDGIRFLTLVLALLSVLSNGLGGLAGFLGSFSRGLGGHVDGWVV